jgi:hypothetical protein
MKNDECFVWHFFLLRHKEVPITIKNDQLPDNETLRYILIGRKINYSSSLIDALMKKKPSKCDAVETRNKNLLTGF